VKKKDIINKLYEGEICESKSVAEKFFNAFIEVLKDGLNEDGDVQITGFGSFVVKDRPARKGRNPRTGEEIDIKASKTVRFKPGKKLKESFV
jgi:DNA-binding protein HU-beta